MFKRTRLPIKHIFGDIEKYKSNNITVVGWIDSIRIQQANGIAFISLNDGSCLSSLQLILDPKCDEDIHKLDTIYKDGTKGVSIKASGILVDSPAKGQLVELKVDELKIFGKVCASDYPIAKKKLTLEYIRKFPHLRIRTKTVAALARLRNTCSKATHDFFQNHGFKYVHTPILTSNDCEGAGETFDISNEISVAEPFFSKPINLTVSGQLHGETYACGLSDIYTFGPTFRAENSNTSRHLAEFWMIEPEICFIDLKDLIDISEDYLKYCLEFCFKSCKEDLEFMNKQYDATLIERLTDILSKPFARMTYTEVIDILKKEIEDGRAIIRDHKIEAKKFRKLSRDKHIFEEEPYWGCDLGSEHEKYMTDKIVKGVLVVYDYPKEIKSFYMKENVDKKTVQAMDILVPHIGELVGGSIREEKYDILKSKMEQKSLDIPWYLDLRKFGTVPHGGFGLGFERLIMLISGIENIKDVIPYPRYPRHCMC
jgi:asparaginyl-tRNA synthetase